MQSQDVFYVAPIWKIFEVQVELTSDWYSNPSYQQNIFLNIS